MRLNTFLEWADQCERHVAHNIHFDARLIKASCMKCGMAIESFDAILDKTKRIDTMSKSMKFVGATRLNQNNKPVLKFPTLQELYVKLFGKQFDNSHTSDCDVLACMESYDELIKRGILII